LAKNEFDINAQIWHRADEDPVQQTFASTPEADEKSIESHSSNYFS